MTNQQALVLVGILKSVVAELGSDYPLFEEMAQLKALQASLQEREKKNQPSINSVANFPEKSENG